MSASRRSMRFYDASQYHAKAFKIVPVEEVDNAVDRPEDAAFLVYAQVGRQTPDKIYIDPIEFAFWTTGDDDPIDAIAILRREAAREIALSAYDSKKQMMTHTRHPFIVVYFNNLDRLGPIDVEKHGF